MPGESQEDKDIDLPKLYTNGLNAMIQSHNISDSVTDELADLEAYANLMEDMSDIQEIQGKIYRNIDELTYDDIGFLGTYEDFSFCSTAQVQNANVSQLQGTRIVSQTGMNNVQNHEMQEPLISKVISAQTSTGEGLQAAKFIHEKVFRQKEKK